MSLSAEERLRQLEKRMSGSPLLPSPALASSAAAFEVSKVRAFRFVFSARGRVDHHRSNPIGRESFLGHTRDFSEGACAVVVAVTKHGGWWCSACVPVPVFAARRQLLRRLRLRLTRPRGAGFARVVVSTPPPCSLATAVYFHPHMYRRRRPLPRGLSSLTHDEPKCRRANTGNHRQSIVSSSQASKRPETPAQAPGANGRSPSTHILKKRRQNSGRSASSPPPP